MDTRPPFIPPKIYDANGHMGQPWFVYYSVRQHHGKLKRFKKYVSMKLDREARYRALYDLETQINKMLYSGHYSVVEKMEVNVDLIKALHNALDYKRPFISHRTFNSFNAILDRFESYLMAQDLCDITSRNFHSYHAIGFMEHIAQTGIKAKTYNCYKGMIKVLFDRLLEKEQVKENPFSKIKNLKVEDPDLEFWEDHEAKKVFEVAKEHDYGCYLVMSLVYCCFLRPNEICHLKYEDIKDGMIRLRSGITKNSKTRHITLPKWLEEAINARQKKHGSPTHLFSKGLLPGDKHCHRNTISAHFRAVRKKAGLRAGLHLYGLKHKGNLDIHLKGATLEEIRQQNRHYDLSITSKYLTRIVHQANEKFRDFEMDF